MTPSGVFNAIQVLRTEMGKGFDRLHERIDQNHDNTTEKVHEVDRRVVKCESDLNGLGQRIDDARVEIKDASGPGKAGWAGILIASVTAAGSAVVSYFKSRGH